MKWFRKIFDRLRIEHLWALTVMVGIFAFLNTHPIRPHDFWWHMAIGRDTLASGQVPTTDIYSYTQPGDPYLSYYQFWLMDVFLYVVYRAGGALLTVLMQMAMIFPAYFILLWIGWRLTRSWRAAALAVFFAAAMGFGNWNVRPQAASYLLGVLILWAVYELRLTGRKRWLWVFPLVMALWVNCHGSFPIGLALIGCWLAERGWQVFLTLLKQRRWDLRPLGLPLAGLGLGLAACLLNPRGVGFVDYLSMMAGNTIVQNFILEWMPPTFNSLEGSIFLFGLLLVAVLLAVSPKRPNIFQIVQFLLFGFLGLKYIRGVVWFGITLAPIVAVHLAALLEQAGVKESTEPPTQQQRRLNAIFAVTLLLLAFVSLPWFKSALPLAAQKKGLVSTETPVEATRYMLENNLPPQVFHDMAFGSYLVWAGQPAFKVFVDSRVELYPMTVWDDYWSLTNAASNWEELIDQYGIQTLMLEPEKQIELIRAASASPGWELVYQDHAAVIFTRR